jgi:hypothetical protein
MKLNESQIMKISIWLNTQLEKTSWSRPRYHKYLIGGELDIETIWLAEFQP